MAAGLRGLVVLFLCLAVLLSGGWSLRPRSAPGAPAIAPSTPAGALQEVAPPLPVQQLQERLAGLQPQLRILSPSNEAVLPAGPWELRLALDDWPLVQDGALGLGPHLVVQVDGQPPLRLVAPPGEGGSTTSLQVPMAALGPGSHLLTVYAARPWGEAVKSNGGFQQLRLHRVAKNLLQIPAPGSAQLISAIPAELLTAEPVPIDWLLVDTPLQQLRDATDRRWLLRVTVNGDSFLIDRQTTVWLRGFRPGSNAVQLELLDGLGEPLNPPFNSLVQEVVLRGDGGSRWQRGRLTSEELDQFLGRAPVATSAETAGSAETRESVETEELVETTMPTPPGPAELSAEASPAEPAAAEPLPEPAADGDGRPPAPQGVNVTP